MNSVLAEFTIFGITFHTYGIIMAVAIAVVLKIAEQFIGSNQSKKDTFWDASLWMLVGAGVGSRLWHIVTDWQLYAQNPLQSLFIWKGGLSIMGALAGLVSAAWLFSRKKSQKIVFFELTDALVIGLPFGQAIGRLGNLVNQELYGSPTSLPWKLYISQEHRLRGYENQDYYHPLFLYEAVLMVLGGVALWLVARKSSKFKVGSGFVTIAYFALYGWVRFLLEFLRIDKAMLLETGWGINQVIALVVACTATVIFWKRAYK